MTDTVEKTTSTIPSLASYYQLGRSGLRVSPLCLGTMTFGTEWGFGSDEETARGILDRYVAAGGNFIDTADGYTNGTSEKIIGQWMADRDNRQALAVATKFTFPTRMGDPNAYGNTRKHIHEAVEASLDRLQTDHIDLYWLHAWDGLTPAEEVLRTMNDLVSAGLVHYFGLSDVPAWYVGQMATLADWRGWPKPVALQLEYSLAVRTIEFEYVDAAHEFGMSITPWSPLAGGLLSGKYRKDNGELTGEGRIATQNAQGNTAFSKATDRNFAIVDELVAVAKELGQSPASVALNWITTRRGIGSTIIGATSLEQLESNMSCLEFTIPAKLSARLAKISAPDVVFPYTFFSSAMRERFTGGLKLQSEPPWYR